MIDSVYHYPRYMSIGLALPIKQNGTMGRQLFRKRYRRFRGVAYLSRLKHGFESR
jgi:hypothetical protein